MFKNFSSALYLCLSLVSFPSYMVSEMLSSHTNSNCIFLHFSCRNFRRILLPYINSFFLISIEKNHKFRMHLETKESQKELLRYFLTEWKKKGVGRKLMQVSWSLLSFWEEKKKKKRNSTSQPTEQKILLSKLLNIKQVSLIFLSVISSMFP